MMLHESQLVDIVYTKDNGEKSDRTIVPTYVPNTNPLVRAIDVTDLSGADQARIEQLVREYREYKDRILNTMFTFESWVAHTHNIDISPKWRSFKPSNIDSI